MTVPQEPPCLHEGPGVTGVRAPSSLRSLISTRPLLGHVCTYYEYPTESEERTRGSQGTITSASFEHPAFHFSIDLRCMDMGDMGSNY